MKRFVCVLVCISLCLTGCGSIQLTDNERGMISEYAAYVVLKHNRLYHSRLQDEVYETEPETTAVIQTSQPTTDETGGSGASSNSMETESINALARGLGLEGFEAEYTGYSTMNTYADDYFNFSATEGKTLLILHFNITNPSEQEKEANVLVNQFKFRCTVNHEKRVGSQLTMLLNDLYSFKEVLAPGETKEAVLVFQIPEKYENAIEALDLTVKNEEENHRYNLPDIAYVTAAAEEETVPTQTAQ